ncbi:endolytic transglycosylase MltG [Neolewinella lacunae]|uniref:Endolytic murein transglycosylase n=1 Tax=Neolewinella lacunae TaxID=1517758 RepID=A0A923T9J5_9BACT|nr:endolytic transglycosylase MltG [Neolewinella lacunae]MBC6995589.1 endolytic transglycosylase MltG [Neolewinella lacunae]MDN3635625.1 endolytic transglycosylase MltG [Neolewinella lacunae]
MLKKILLALVILGTVIAGYVYYRLMLAPVVPNDLQNPVVTIPTGATYEQVLDSLAAIGVRPDRALFDPLAERMAYRKPVMRAGRYRLEPGMGYIDLLRKLRSGSREAVKVVLTTEREPENVAAKVARFLEGDSLAFVRLFQDQDYIKSLGYTRETLQTLFIPNTYEMYWDATPRQFMERMVKEHQRFWDAEGRREKAKALGMTPTEVYILASIVEKESLVAHEQPRVAGLYLNRLRQGMRLEADPTAVFATRDFLTTRVLYSHTSFESPYNTYLHTGLPPGPITMPSVGSIDGVLNPEKHDYIFMCARGDNSGEHNFASTMAGHTRNIAVYVANLKSRGLR